MLRFVFSLVFLVSLTFELPLLSQDTLLIKDLEKRLPGSDGLNRLEILNNLSWELKYSDLNRAFSLANEALSLSESLDNNKGLMLACKNLAICYFLKTDMAKAEEYVDKSLEFVETSEDIYLNGKIYNIKAVINRELRKTGLAMKYQNKALEMFRSINDSAEISGNLHNLALLYERINENEKALNLYYEVFEIERRLENKFGIARTSNNLAGVLINLGKIELAIKYYNLAFENFEAVGNSNGVAASLHGLGLVYSNQDENLKAIEYYKKAYDINFENGYQEYLANNCFQLGQSYTELGDNSNALYYYNQAKEAYFKLNNLRDYGATLFQTSYVYKLLGNENLCLEYAQNALNVAKLNGTLEVLARSSYIIYEIKRKLGKLNEAIEYLESYAQIRDSIRKIDKENMMLEIQARYEFDFIENENARLIVDSTLKEQQIRNQKIILTGVIIIASLLLFLVIIIFINRKKVQYKNRLLQESNNTRDKFFSIIAHDLKNPFSGLLGFSDLLVRNIEMKDRQTLKTYAETLYKSINHTYQLVENLLDWSRSQRNILEIFTEDLSIHETVSNTLSVLSSLAREKKITLINEVPKDVVIQTDRHILTTILRNLISNAIKFTGDNGRVEINARLKEQGVLISVTDNGTGIEKGNVHNLFKMNYVSSTSGTHDEPGTGLGLMLCQEFVEKLDGKIWVESELGKGSTFSFFLPEKN
ncbi:MAG: tetratricopeptide repeat protein [Bacteroidetes bacterium]|nr:tetratricopeptide repeat protein [Bacteroidota bacterium]